MLERAERSQSARAAPATGRPGRDETGLGEVRETKFWGEDGMRGREERVRALWQ